MKVAHEHATRIPYESATGDQVKALRLSQRVQHRPMSQAEFAAILHTEARQVKRWEKSGMRAHEWLLTRITFDPLLRAQWFADVSSYTQRFIER